MYSFGVTKSSFIVQSSPCTILAYLLIKPDIEGLWLCAEFTFQNANPFRCYDLCNRIIGVFNITDLPRTERTGLNAGGLQPFGYPVIAEIAFLGRMVFWVEKPDAIGTC